MAKKKKAKILPSAVRSETPVYDQVVADSGFAPHNPLLLPLPGWGNIPNTAGMMEDNFS